jgi:EAL domain-containing protein (putative c-di-GMP-specific phosphodiesterase class I)
VNISPVQLYGDDLVAQTSEILAETGFEPSCLTLEITEGTLLDDLEIARERLSALRSLGVRIAIDDFGTGYSSLAYMSGLPADTVKIDRSFVKGLTVRSGPSVLVQAVVDMANALGLSVVAEGVEDAEQQAVLNQLYCPFSQGFLYSPPLPAIRFAELAARWDVDGRPVAASPIAPDRRTVVSEPR